MHALKRALLIDILELHGRSTSWLSPRTQEKTLFNEGRITNTAADEVLFVQRMGKKKE